MFYYVEGANIQAESKKTSNEPRQQVNLSAENDMQTDSEGECSTPVESQSVHSSQPTLLESVVDDIRLHPFQPRNIQFPFITFGKKKRCFRANWFDLYKWLEWDPVVKRVFCHQCRMARKLNLISFSHRREHAFTTSGYTNWKHATDSFKIHEQSSTHKEAVLKWSGYLSLRSVAQQLNENDEQEKQLRRETLIQLFDSLRFLARQGLATRGHTDTASNYHHYCTQGRKIQLDYVNGCTLIIITSGY